MRRALLGIVAIGVLLAEAYVLLRDSDGTFVIRGRESYSITEFASGATVAHAFLMRGNGLQTVWIRLSSERSTQATLHWGLWTGIPDTPLTLRRAFTGEESVILRPGPQWVPIQFPRHGSSDGRWFTIELRLASVAGGPPDGDPSVTVLASRDNPTRGGALWVKGNRQPGSLMLEAEWQGRTPYRRFMIEAAPNLPKLFAMPFVQWALVLMVNWSCLIFVSAVWRDASSGAPIIAAPVTTNRGKR
jgi:hypothetical protein